MHNCIDSLTQNLPVFLVCRQIYWLLVFGFVGLNYQTSEFVNLIIKQYETSSGYGFRENSWIIGFAPEKM